MVAECFIIAVIIGAMALFCYRNKRDHAIAIIPLLVLPVVNIVGYYLADKLAIIIPFDTFTTYCIVDLLAVIVSSFLVGLWSTRFTKKSTKTAYVTISLIFNVVFAGILIYNMFILLNP